MHLNIAVIPGHQHNNDNHHQTTNHQNNNKNNTEDGNEHFVGFRSWLSHRFHSVATAMRLAPQPPPSQPQLDIEMKLSEPDVQKSPRLEAFKKIKKRRKRVRIELENDGNLNVVGSLCVLTLQELWLEGKPFRCYNCTCVFCNACLGMDGWVSVIRCSLLHDFCF